MVTILGKSDKPCFLCGTSERTVSVKFRDGCFAGTLCMEHLYERLEEKLTFKKADDK
jgi:hypothetical protein